MLNSSGFVESYTAIGGKKANSPTFRLLLLGILAGFLIGMGSAVTNVAVHSMANVSAAKVIGGLLFPFGLIAVILTGAELFTGNCFLIMPALSRQIRIGAMLRNLGLVYLGNLIGAIALAAAYCFSGQMNLSGGHLAVYTMKVAAAKCSLSFESAVVLGILCNILVCIGVMCALCAKDVAGRTAGAFGPVCFFVVCGFEHCVANMYYISAGLFALSNPDYSELASVAGVNLSALTWNGFLLHNLLPVTIGNLIGGVAFAALIWAANHKKEQITE